MFKTSKALRTLCCLLTALTTVSLSACVTFSTVDTQRPSGGSYKESSNSDRLPSFGGNTETDDGDKEDDGGEKEDDGNDNDNGNTSDPNPPVTDDPNPEKTVLKEEVDCIGHKVVTYTDGTWEDLGRAVALSYTSPAPETQYGYTYFATQTNGSGLNAFYEDIYQAAQSFHANGKTLSEEDGYYRVASLDFSKYGLTSAQAAGVWRIFVNENPAYFWISDSILTGSSTLVLLLDEAYASATVRAQTQTKIEEMALECDGYLSGKTTKAERALTVHDYLVLKMDYAYKADGVTPETEIWAHSLAGAAEGSGVCEAYAKAYDYLCGLFGIECLTVTGRAYSGGSWGGHAWNIIELDGAWHCVDTTWSDGGDKTVRRDYFGAPYSDFCVTHRESTPDDGWGINYLYALPDLSYETLSPVAYGIKNSGNYTIAGSLQQAYAGMTDTSAHYAAYLYPDTKASLAMEGEIVRKGAATEYTRTPSVASLTLYGEYVTSGSGYILSELTLKNTVIFSCPVTLSNLHIKGDTVNTGKYILTTVGLLVQIDTPRVISESGGGVLSQTTEYTELPALSVNNLTVVQGELRLTGGGTARNVLVQGGTLRCHGLANITLTNLCLHSKAERLYLDGMCYATTVSIGSVSCGENGVAALDDYALFFIVYNSLDEYPIIKVENIEGTAPLCLGLYGSVAPTSFGATPIVTLGGGAAYSELQILFAQGGVFREVSGSLFTQNTDGEVVLKS